MKILSIDTASNICGVSILENEKLLCKLDENTGKTHSENLMPMINKAFEKCQMSLHDINLIVCDKGPGSFTGIRIGVATVNAFHDSLNMPCLGVSSLDALAYLVKNEGFILSIIDCKNNNCYFALYELKNGIYNELIPPSSSSITEALNLCINCIAISKTTAINDYLSLNNIPFTVVGDASICYKDMISDFFANYFNYTSKESSYIFKNINLHFSDCNELDSYCLAMAGFDKFKTNNQLSNEPSVLPLYLKKPQAQRQLEEKLKLIKISNMSASDLNLISHDFLSFDNFWDFSVLNDEFNSPNSYYIVAKLQDKIVGFAGIKVMFDEADIMNIAVRKDFRNQGIGSLLLENLIHLTEELTNINFITLEVMDENYSAIHLYQKFNFEKCGIRKNYYKGKNAIIMKKRN